MLFVLCSVSLPSGSIAAQEVKIWEFSPYEVEVWYTFDSSVSLSETARTAFLEQLDGQLDRTFRAAWNSRYSELSPELVGIVSSNFDNFELQDLVNNELVLITSLVHEQSKTLRSYDAAIRTLPAISVSSTNREKLLAEATRTGHLDEAKTKKLIDKCVVVDGGWSTIAEQLLSASIPAALVRRSEMQEASPELRSHVTLLPWQTESKLRTRDKLFFLLVAMEGDEFVLKVRELDCPMQFFGPAFEASTRSWSHAARVAASVTSRAFAPVARVEEAQSKSAKLRQRAGGLIVSDNNPAALAVGDIMQPVVRRDDRNGIPTLLEPLAWTFAAVTATDGVKLESNVYSYSGGPGLQGRKNRRTRRVLLRVRPRYDETDIQVVVRGSKGRTQPGCFVYDRDLITGDFNLLGRTDWRGRFTIPVPNRLGGFLPEAIRKERFRIAKLDAAKAAAAVDSEKGEITSAEVDSGISMLPETPKADTANDPDALQLNFPLTQIYIKNGNTVLAKLPMVPGLKEIEIAVLPDDRRRLQSEAFVRGFQGEILDLIALRNLLAARVKLYIRDGKLDSATEAVDKLRSLRNYNEMADQLGKFQRDMLDEASGAISLREKSRIDRMFQTTRNLLQKYLQDSLLSDVEQTVKQAKAAAS